ERGRYNDHGINERRLVGEAPGRSAVIGRARYQPHRSLVAQHHDRAFERGAHVTDIAAEREQSLGRRPSHDLQVRVRSIVTPTSSNVAATGAWGLCTVMRTPRTCGQRASTASATAPAAASTRR